MCKSLVCNVFLLFYLLQSELNALLGNSETAEQGPSERETTNPLQSRATTPVPAASTTAVRTQYALPVVRLVDVMRPENRGEDLNTEIVTAASSANQSPVPVKTLPVPGKRLPVPCKTMPPPGKKIPVAVKKLPSGKKLPTKPVESGNDEGDEDESGREDNYIHDHAATDGRDSSSSESEESDVAPSDKGERVDSPVQAATSTKSTRERKKKKRKRDSSSSSSDSARSEYSRASQLSRQSYRIPKKSKQDPKTHSSSKRHDKTEKREKRRSSQSSTRSPTRSPSHNNRSRSPTRSVQSSGGKRRRHERQSTTPVHSTESSLMPPPARSSLSRLELTKQAAPAPPTLTDALSETDSLYRSILKAKSSQGFTQDPDTLSKSTTKSKRVVKQKPATKPRQTIDMEELKNMLDENICDSDLSAETVKMIANRYANVSYQSRKHSITEDIQYITFHPNSSVDFPPGSPALEANYPRIDEGKYLFSASKGNFGFNVDAVSNRLDNAQYSLYYALRTNVNKATHSLDRVFRKALKDLVNETHIFNELSNTLENPMFISARYLELTLLQKIRSYYKKEIHEDIVVYFARASTNETYRLDNLVRENACEKYIRLLYDRYVMTPPFVIDKHLDEPLGVSQMRAWTNKKNQIAVNIVFLNYLRSVFDALKSDWSRLSGAERKPMVKEFCDEYSKRMRPFLLVHKVFLSEMLQASELMAWTCFGITMDDPDTGFVNMALSYFMVENGKQTDFEKYPFLCWNYPLASKFKRDQAASTGNRMVPITDFWAKLELVEQPETEQVTECGSSNATVYTGAPHQHTGYHVAPAAVLGGGGAVIPAGGHYYNNSLGPPQLPRRETESWPQRSASAQ